MLTSGFNSGSATPTNDRDLHTSPSTNTTNILATRVASMPRLPIEICERIMDFFLNVPHADGYAYNDRTSLSACSLVCKAWQHRARFHLCDVVDLYSREHLLSFAAFLSSRPDLCTRVAHLNLWGYSYSQSTERQDDSWTSSAPLMLPALPNLTSFRFTNIDFSHQHAIFDKGFAKFKYTSNIESVDFYDYLDMSSTTFSHCARLARVLGTKEIQFEACTFNGDISGRAVPRYVHPARWWVSAPSWMELGQTSWDQHILTPLPNLYQVYLQVEGEASEDWESCFTPQGEHLWSRIYQMFHHLVSIPKKQRQDGIVLAAPMQREVVVDLGGHHIELNEFSGARCISQTTSCCIFSSVGAQMVHNFSCAFLRQSGFRRSSQ